MNTDVIIKKTREIKNHRHHIRVIKEEEEDVNIQLRVFTKGSWREIDFNPEHKPIKNYVICQLILDLENKIKQCEEIIKK